MPRYKVIWEAVPVEGGSSALLRVDRNGDAFQRFRLSATQVPAPGDRSWQAAAFLAAEQIREAPAHRYLPLEIDPEPQTIVVKAEEIADFLESDDGSPATFRKLEAGVLITEWVR